VPGGEHPDPGALDGLLPLLRRERLAARKALEGGTSAERKAQPEEDRGAAPGD